jgi:hypothetical protein
VKILYVGGIRMSIIEILTWLFFVTLPVSVVLGAIAIAVLIAIARTFGLWVAVLFGCLLVASVISTIKKDEKISQYQISLRMKEINGEPLTPMEHEVLHPHESWKHRYPGPGYYQPK